MPGIQLRPFQAHAGTLALSACSTSSEGRPRPPLGTHALASTATNEDARIRGVGRTQRAATGEGEGGCWGGASRAPVDPEDTLLVSVLRHSLTSPEIDARQLRHKNAKALQLAIEQSEHEATAEAVAKAQVLRLAKE